MLHHLKSALGLAPAGHGQGNAPSPTPSTTSDMSSAFRNIFDPHAPPQTHQGGMSGPAGTTAAGAWAGAAALGLGGAGAAQAPCAAPAAAATPGEPAGPAGQPLGFGQAPAEGADGAGLGDLAQQLLTQQSAIQQDPVAAARQLQAFLLQYKERYGADTDVRIEAAVGRLQDYVALAQQQQQQQGGPLGFRQPQELAAGVTDAVSSGLSSAAGALASAVNATGSAAVSALDAASGGALSAASAGPAAAGAAAAAAAAAGSAEAGGRAAAEAAPQYHNYILEQLTATLDWINSLMLTNPKPYMFDSYGRVIQDSALAERLRDQQEQLRAAAGSLRVLITELKQLNAQFSAVADSEERAAMGQVLQQLSTMADRLATAAARRPVPPPAAGAAADAAAAASGTIDAAASAVNVTMDIAPYVRPETLYGADRYRDPVLKVLDGVYHAVVVDSGLREFLVGIKQLGDALAVSMAQAWTGAPPLGRLVAYIAAVAGVLFIMRTRLPQALLQPTRSSTALPPGETQPAQYASELPGSGEGAHGGPATAAAWWGAGRAASPRSGRKADGGSAGGGVDVQVVGGTPLRSPLLSSDVLRAGSRSGGSSGGDGGEPTGVDGSDGARPLPGPFASPSTGYSRAASVSGSGAGGGGGLLAGGGVAGMPRPPPGGWTSEHSDRADWWDVGGGSGSGLARAQQQQQQQQQYQQQVTVSASAAQQEQRQRQQQQPVQAGVGTDGRGAVAASPRQRSLVAESWDAFRRIEAVGAAALGRPAAAGSKAPASSSPSAVGTAAAMAPPSAAVNAAAGDFSVLDTTAAMAAAAVAAAAVGSAPLGDPKMAELARATEERRIGKERVLVRAEIKDRLRLATLALGPVSSVVPGGEPLRAEVDRLLAALEALSPTDKPLNTQVDVASRPTLGRPPCRVDPLLLGDWRLVYASNAGAAPQSGPPPAGGPNLLAQVLQIADSLPGFGMTHVVQRLSMPHGSGTATNTTNTTGGSSNSYGSGTSSWTPAMASHTVHASAVSNAYAGPTGRPLAAAAAAGGGAVVGGVAAASVTGVTLVTENSAMFSFGPLGSWRVTVQGTWVDNGGGMCAAAEFHSFAVRPVELWGVAVASLLPEVAVPVPELLRSRSEWCTTYLDEDTRIGRGTGGAVFLFRRGAEPEDEERAAASGGFGAALAGEVQHQQQQQQLGPSVPMRQL